jgi:hypothetical protein
MNIWEKMLNLDRRWIFLLMGLACIIPFFTPLGLPILPSQEVISIYDYIENLDEDNAIFIGFDFDPGTDAENQPMAEAVLRHALSRNVPVFITSVTPLGQGLASLSINRMTNPIFDEHFALVSWADWDFIRQQGLTEREDIVAAWEAEGNALSPKARGWVFEGLDLCHLGYLPYFSLVILGMSSSIVSQYPEDVSGNPVEEMPIYQEHKSLREIDLAVTNSGTAVVTWWVIYGREKIGLPVAFGVTAVSATDYYIYIQSGQIIGQMGGLRGAAEYETLLMENGYSKLPGAAFIGMDVQSIAHLLIIFFVVLGNIAYFAGGFNKQTKLKGRG